MRQWPARDFARLLERHGWQLLRIHGSHHVYGRAGSAIRLAVPIHGNRPLKLGYCGTWQLAEIPEDELR